MNVYHLLDQTAARWPDRGAVYLGAGLRLTYGALRDRALSLAGGLMRHHAAGDRIAVFSENCPDYPELLFGIWAAEMAVAPINAKLHPREAVQILGDSGARMVFASTALAGGLRGAVAAAGLAGCEVVGIGGADHAALMATPRNGAVPSDPEALAWLFYTSGTTGRSKGAMLTHRNLMAMTIAHLADIEPLTGADTQIHAAPMSHGSGLYLLSYVARGSRLVIPQSGGFDPAEFLDLCEAHPGIGAFFAPTMVQRLRREVEARGRRPANLRCITYGGGPMYLEELRKARAALGDVLAQIYGQGEAPMTITGLRQDAFRDAGDEVLASVGYPRSGVQVAVVDSAGTALPPGEVGEVICRGDVVMRGYWNNPAATAAALRDGWLWTGDMGSLDARGCLTLRDRSRDVVISGGSNIYPREVEEALLTHPGVAEVCVLGLPDAEWGEIVVAVIVPEPGHSPDPADLDAHCRDRIARFKRPKRYVLAESLPKSNYGKVLKREMRVTLMQGS